MGSLAAVPIPPEIAAKLRTAGHKVDEWTTERNRLIAEASAAGGSLREIAEHAGISHTGVKKILERER